MARSDRDEIVRSNGDSWWKRGARGTILHTWGDGSSDVVPVVLLASPLGGDVPVRATPYDGGDFHAVLPVRDIVPLSDKF